MTSRERFEAAGIKEGTVVRVLNGFENIATSPDPSYNNTMSEMAGKTFIVSYMSESYAKCDNGYSWPIEWIKAVRQPQPKKEKVSSYHFLGEADEDRLCRETLECGQLAFVMISRDDSFEAVFNPAYSGPLHTYCGFIFKDIDRDKVSEAIKEAKEYSTELKKSVKAMGLEKEFKADIAKALKDMEIDRRSKKNKVMCF